MHCKFKCITVNFDETQHGIYINYNFLRNSLYKIHFIISIIKQLQSLFIGIKTSYVAKQVMLNRIFNWLGLVLHKLYSEDIFDHLIRLTLLWLVPSHIYMSPDSHMKKVRNYICFNQMPFYGFGFINWIQTWANNLY